jgi:hypothetical protein
MIKVEPDATQQVKDVEPPEPLKRKKEEPFACAPIELGTLFEGQEVPEAPKEGEKKTIKIQIQIHRVEKSGAGEWKNSGEIKN